MKEEQGIMGAREDRQITVIAPWVYVDYITKGKEYTGILIDEKMGYFIITNDKGKDTHCLLKRCPHLEYGNWIIK